MKIDTKAKYASRYAKRGAKQKKHWARCYIRNITSTSIGDYNKPNHQDRAVAIEACFPAIGRKVEQAV